MGGIAAATLFTQRSEKEARVRSVLPLPLARSFRVIGAVAFAIVVAAAN